ncbi:MAG: hypothetical protein ABSB22_19660 [Thermodesulfobacteriota bacterium]
MAKRKCRYCGRWFVPYPRVGKRQKHPDYQRQWRQRKKAKRRRTPGEIRAEILLKSLVITTEKPLLSFRAY